mgnify:CR=1 FL=1
MRMETFLSITEAATRRPGHTFADLPAFVRPAFEATGFNASFCYEAWIRGFSAAQVGRLQDVKD